MPTLVLGGIAAEFPGDVATLVPPVSGEEITGVLRGLRPWPLLDGHRGRHRPDGPAAIGAALVLARLPERSATLEEIEFDPLIPSAEGVGAVAIEALPEIRSGTVADAASIRLPRRLPLDVTMDMLLTGRRMDAAEARHWGLVREVTPAEALARLFADGPSLVVAAI